MKDSLWLLDLFRVESITLNTHWIMVVMDQYTRRVARFSVHAGDLNGITICCIFNKIKSGKSPKYLSSDNDPLFRFHRWLANLRIMEVTQIKSVPYTPTSHPFVERLIGSVRRELLDHTLFWNANDLQNKLNEYQVYFNRRRGHCGINGRAPFAVNGAPPSNIISLDNYRWEKYCRGLFQLPMAA
jgi:putative transposase